MSIALNSFELKANTAAPSPQGLPDAYPKNPPDNAPFPGAHIAIGLLPIKFSFDIPKFSNGAYWVITIPI
jgi:hypothetical protein